MFKQNSMAIKSVIPIIIISIYMQNDSLLIKNNAMATPLALYHINRYDKVNHTVATVAKKLISWSVFSEDSNI